MGFFEKIFNKDNNDKIEQELNVPKRVVVNDSEFGGFVISKNVIAGKPIRYTYREKTTIENLNGWNIYSFDDDDEYVSNPDNFEIVSATTINNIAPIMLDLFYAPYGTDVCWMYDKNGKHIGFYDLVKNEDTTLEKILGKNNSK